MEKLLFMFSCLAVSMILTNGNPNAGVAQKMDLMGNHITKSSAKIITGDAIDAHNTFEKPDFVTDKSFKDYHVNENTLQINIPPKSLLVFEIQ